MPTKTPTGYAIVAVAGKQFHVVQGQELIVPRTQGEIGANLTLDEVLLYHDGASAHFGQPVVSGATVDATILGHGRHKKITVFHFRRRKGYRKTNGHRQGFSILRINGIHYDKSTAVAAAGAAKRPAAKATPAGTSKQTADPKKPAEAAAAARAKTKPATKQSSATQKTSAKLATRAKAAAKTGTAAKPGSGAKQAAARKPRTKQAATPKTSAGSKQTAGGKQAAAGKTPAGRKSGDG